MGDNFFHEYCIHQLGEREDLAITLTTPAICLSTIDDDFFMLGVISLLDEMQHLSIDQIYISHIH
jgi:hypothetical protein